MTPGRSLRRLLVCVAFLATLLSVAHAHPGAPAAQPEAREYRLWYRNYDSPAVLAALRLAFDKTPEYGEYRITRSTEMVQGRALLELHHGDADRQVDIADVATSPSREDSLYAIPLPIDGGLLGFRVCVVRRDRLDRFGEVDSISALADRGLSIGQGTHWPDTDILRANGVDVVTHPRYETLFTMLRAGRFDCFARGVSEVLYDLAKLDGHDLVIEPDLLIAYPMPAYFFVGPEDHETAQRIELGLERAIADGSFGRFLADYYGRAVEELNLDERRMLILENPFLSEESAPIGREALETLRERIRRARLQQPEDTGPD